MPKRGKLYRENAAKYEKANLYEIEEAMTVDTLTSRLEVQSFCRTVPVRPRRFWYSQRDLRQQKQKQLVLIM